MIKRKNLSQIKCIVAQVDDVLTDGKTWLNHLGHKQRKFSVCDSMSIRPLTEAGNGFAVDCKGQSRTAEQKIADQFGQVGIRHFIKADHLKSRLPGLFLAPQISHDERVFFHSTQFPLENNFLILDSVANAPQSVRTSVEHMIGSAAGEVLDHGRQPTHELI